MCVSGGRRRWGGWPTGRRPWPTAFELAHDPDLGPGQAARMRLEAGDLAGYRKECEKLLASHADTKSVGTAAATAWTCVLAPEAVADPAPVVKLAETALAGRPDDPAALTTLGAALYRTGQFEPAAQRLEEATAARPGLAPAWFLLALVRERLGKMDEAKTALATGEARMDGSTEARADPPPLSWQQRVEWQALRREAEEALAAKQPR